ncbi:MAG: glycoside hydrolase family 125 protein [Ignavibacteriales bacterium]|nr:glycoside hydrolase family 125 protein [Ignavibacteriales bacterium]MBP9120277.1 glycoside hydrolase family 125 protein [Ignavibacterium sp.]
MPSRRNFIKTSSLAIAGLSLSNLSFTKSFVPNSFISNRPPIAERKFISEAIEAKIVEMKKTIKDEELAWLFENCFPNTLDTTITHKVIEGKPDTFVITGDINAMWLRDSSAQVWPYLQFVNEDKKLKDLVAGVINRQTKCILIDPYANAFNDGPGESPWENDVTDMKPELHERKWEVDSLCYPIRLAYGYWKTTTDVSIFDEDWKSAMKLVLKTFKEQQRKDGKSHYRFMRETAWSTDSLPLGGYGNPINPVGLIVSSFRPSDDATTFSFLVPSNHFAVVSLKQLSEILTEVIKDTLFASECVNLADEVQEALNKYANAEHLNFGKIYPYEVDGFGNKLFMDDANVPSLLSLPYLNAVSSENVLYKNTRKFLFSKNNPYYFEGKAGNGIGGPHAGLGKIWHLSVIMRGITSTDENEIVDCLDLLKSTHANTGFMHESFDKDDASKFTRSWFAWANTLFGEFILKVQKERPHLLQKLF